MDFNFRNTPFQGNSMGSIISLASSLFFPGFFRHHSFWFYGGLQRRENNPYSFYEFSDLINYPRGYAGQDNNDLFTVSFNYKLPLFYPDFNIGSLLYIKRFTLNLFFDYGEGTLDNSLNIYKSTGAELMADLHILRFPLPVNIGVRSNYFPDSNSWGFQFLYAISY